MSEKTYDIWRIWAEGRATLEEIRDTWDITDVATANDMLTYMAAEQDANTPDPPRPKARGGAPW